MAERWAVADGNWSSTATWYGGVKPSVGDDVWANGFTVAIDENAEVNSLRTDNTGSTASDGGRFDLYAELTADVYAGLTDGANIYSGGVLIGDSYGSDYDPGERGATIYGGGYQIGNSYGGSASSAYGTYCINGGYQIGNSYGGSDSSAYGIRCIGGGYQIGNSYGGSASGAYGTSCSSGSYQIGNSTGGSVSHAYGTYCQSGGYQIGNSTGGSASGAYGTYCNDGYLAVGEIVNPSNGVYGAYGSFLFFNGLSLSDISGSSNTEITQTDTWSLATEHWWRPMFVDTGGGSSLPLVGLGGLVY